MLSQAQGLGTAFILVTHDRELALRCQSVRHPWQDVLNHEFTLHPQAPAPTARGIVHAVTGVLPQGGNILTSAQHGDADHQRFFMRIEFEAPSDEATLRRLPLPRWPARVRHGLTLPRHRACKARVLILVSKFGHCLNDILGSASRPSTRPSRSSPSPATTAISNNLAASHNILFHHSPLLGATPEQTGNT